MLMLSRENRSNASVTLENESAVPHLLIVPAISPARPDFGREAGCAILRRCSSTLERLICNQQMECSIPPAGSIP